MCKTFGLSYQLSQKQVNCGTKKKAQTTKHKYRHKIHT